MSSMSLSNNQKNELLFVGFNQDYGELVGLLYLFTSSVILPAFFMYDSAQNGKRACQVSPNREIV